MTTVSKSYEQGPATKYAGGPTIEERWISARLRAAFRVYELWNPGPTITRDEANSQIEKELSDFFKDVRGFRGGTIAYLIGEEWARQMLCQELRRRYRIVP